MSSYKSKSIKFKLKIIDKFKCNKLSQKEVCKKYNLSKSSVSNWLKRPDTGRTGEHVLIFETLPFCPPQVVNQLKI